MLALAAFALPLSASSDVDGYVRDGEGRPVSDVKVTDGFNIVKTDAEGHYVLNVHDNADFVYISIPSGYETASRNGAPLFYKTIDKTQQTSKIDFDLVATGKDEFKHIFFLWADVQVYRESELEYVRTAAEDAKAVAAGYGLPAFGLSCGDISGDSTSAMAERIHKTAASAGFPFFTLMGNHDFRAGVGTNEESKGIYKAQFGPTYYSFDKGNMHYVVLDDVFYFERHYMGYLEYNQLEWLKKDLADVPAGNTVVLFMHIPTYSREARNGDWAKENYSNVLTNRSALYDILKPYNGHILSAHEHYAENYVISDNLMEHVHAPLSGLFWQSLYSADGVPWGYYVYEVNGQDLKWYYKPVGKAKDVQFTAYKVGDDPLKSSSIVANVWNYDPSWKVEWRENGVLQGPMTQYKGFDRTIVNDVDNRREKEFTWKYIGAGETEHLFYASPSSVDSEVEIIVTDRFGKVYTWSNMGRTIYSTSSYTLTSEKVIENGNEYVRDAAFATYPKYGEFHGSNILETTLYNHAIYEMVQNMEPDGTFRTGELWAGVWTRDVSYSAILSLAHLAPEVVKTSLLKKVDRKNRIIEDTGTGGSWPCSTDRLVWAVAAYEVYLETGDQSWLKQVYPIIKRSLEADMAVTFNPATGLFRGESSFIDWREQSYPAWMQPADIAASECLGTNAVYYRTLQLMSTIAGKLGATRSGDVKKFAKQAAELKLAINQNFWMEKEGYYAQYIYGRNSRMLSPRSETLGESLCILFGIASDVQAKRIMENLSVGDFGPSVFSPQISSQKSYHNNAVWPFVTSFYGMAAAKCGNTAAVSHALSSNARAAVVFRSNMENMVAVDGSKKTALNSPRQLWSVAGYIGLVHRALFGITYEEEGMRFAPCVPENYKAYRTLHNFKYRDMTLDIDIIGEGKILKECLLDGEPLKNGLVPASLKGHHSVKLIVGGDYYAPRDIIPIEPVKWDLDIPEVTLRKGILSWEQIKGAESYNIYCNGKQIANVTALSYEVAESGEYTVMAVGPTDRYSFVCEPVRVKLTEKSYPVEATLTNKLGSQFKYEIDITKPGEYLIDFEYSNGNGDITTHNKCATRSLYLDRKRVDAVVMPQRGDDWNLSGYTQPVKVELSKGHHTIELRYVEENINMNIDTDEAVLKTLRITQVN